MKNRLVFGIVFVLLLATAVGVSALEQSKAPAAPSAAGQQTFDTPKAAADALIAAAATYDVPALEKILGPDGKGLVVTSDPVQDKNQLEAFAAKAHEKMEIDLDAKDANRAILTVGDEDWPTPVPIVRRNGRWSFDSKAGKREVLYRRVGRNELDAIEFCHDFVDAQHEYALERARRLASEPVRPEGHQHPRKAGRPVMAQRRRNSGRAPGRHARRGDRRGLLEEGRAVSRLLLQGPEGPGLGMLPSARSTSSWRE